MVMEEVHPEAGHRAVVGHPMDGQTEEVVHINEVTMKKHKIWHTKAKKRLSEI